MTRRELRWKPFTRSRWVKWARPGSRGASWFTSSLMSPTYRPSPRSTLWNARSGFPDSNWEGSSTASFRLSWSTAYSQWCANSHSLDDSCSRCCRCSTSWSGATPGATRTSGDAPRKSLSPTKCSMAIEASLLWSDFTATSYLASSWKYLNWLHMHRVVADNPI